MITFLIFIAVLGLLVLSHEWGHFIVARKNGIKVEEFGFGFPPRIGGVRRVTVNGHKKWQFVWRNSAPSTDNANLPTLYSFNLLPFGGFVKIKGEESDDPNGFDSDSFAGKKLWQKAAVLMAGVGMNIAVAWVLLSIVFAVGIPSTQSNAADKELQIVQVLDGKPAQIAGLEMGDVIAQVGDAKNPTVLVFQAYVANNGAKDVALLIKRGQEILTKNISPIIYEDTQKYGIGVAIADVGMVRYPWYTAWYHGLISTFNYLYIILVSLALFIKSLFVAGTPAAEVSGPVGIAVMTGQAARLGLVYLLQFTALISLNLAVINALPIPAIDGGRLFFLILSKIFRKPRGFKFERLLHAVTFVTLLAVIIVVTVKDIAALPWFQQLF